MSAYQPNKRHPLALTLIIAGHGAVLTALALSKMDVPVIPDFGPTYAGNIELTPDPPPPPPPPADTQDKPSQTPSVLDSVPTPVPLPDSFTAPPAPSDPPPPIPYQDVPFPDRTVPRPPLPTPPVPLPPPPAPAPDPVRTEAARDPRYAGQFQPPYPDSLQARGDEGDAVVRVLIGTDGRVKSVEGVRATHPAFMSATVRHARARWRFRPATVDGKPVESWKRMTVTFTLNE